MSRYLLSLLLIFSLAAPLPLRASSVLGVDTDTLVARSEAIVVARVESVSTQWPNGARMPETRVALEVQEVLVGAAPKRLELIYPGGRVGDRQVRIEGQQLPAQGEHGIYVVNDSGRRLVHPLLGWSQGHFTLRRDTGGELRVHSADGRAVLGIDERAGRADRGALSTGSATDLKLGATGTDSAEALSLDAFARLLREKAARLGR